MKLDTTVTVVVNLLCIISARSISQSSFEKRNSLDFTNSAKLSSGDTQKTSKKVSEDKNLSNASIDVVKVINFTEDAISTTQLSKSPRNKILDGVKKATQQRDITTLLDSITGILGSDNLSPTPNSNQSPTPNSSTDQTRPLNSNCGAGTPNGLASIAGSSPNGSSLNVGRPCTCSCLCGSGMIPNASANNPSLTPSSTSQMVAGKGVILSDGGCGCSCSCPVAAFSNTPGMSSPNTAAPPAAPAPAQAQGQSPSQSLPAIISQQTPGQNPPAAAPAPASGQSPPAAPAAVSPSPAQAQAQGQSPSQSLPAIISQQTPGQNPPAAAPVQAQGQTSNSSNPNVAPNPAQAANKPSGPGATPSVPIAVSPPASIQTPVQAPSPEQVPAEAQIAGISNEDPLNIQSFSLTSSLNLGNLVAVPTSIPTSVSGS